MTTDPEARESTVTATVLATDIMAGVSGRDVIDGRPDDSLGMQASYTSFVDDAALFESMNLDGSAGPTGGHELCIEAYYRAQITPWLYMQPGIEWLGSPGGGSTAPLDDAVTGYVMIGVTF